MPNEGLSERLQAAIARREPILKDPKTSCCRLVHGSGDQIPGLQLDQLGSVLVAQFLEDQLREDPDELRAACETLLPELDATSVYRKTYPRDRSRAQERLEAEHADPQPWIGASVEAPFPVVEHGLNYLIHPYDGYATGLFLDARTNRKRVRQRSRDRRVLNLFAYTCGFSVAAAYGGSGEIVSVDVARRALLRGRENFVANELDPEPHKWVAEDVLTYLGRIVRRGERFDLIVIDPPSFGRMKGKKRPFKLEDDLKEMMQLALGCTNPGAQILLACNHRGLSRNEMERATIQASGGRATVMERPKLPLDFPGDGDYAKSIWFEVY